MVYMQGYGHDLFRNGCNDAREGNLEPTDGGHHTVDNASPDASK